MKNRPGLEALIIVFTLTMVAAATVVGVASADAEEMPYSTARWGVAGWRRLCGELL